MLPPYSFVTLLLAIWVFALVRGRSDERLAATVCVLATLSTRFVISPVAVRYSSLEVGLLVIDAAVLAAFVAIALRSHRFWPLWAAGFQLTNSLSHLMKAVDADLIPRAYAAAAVFWSYPILLVILIGTWRTHRRRKSAREPSAT